MTRAGRLVSLLAVTSSVLVLTGQATLAQQDRSSGSGYQPARTSWGDPRIEGLWDFRTLTPFERPAALADKEFFSPEEARAYRDRTIRMLDVDNRGNLPGRFDVEGAYNSFWWDWGTELSEDL